MSFLGEMKRRKVFQVGSILGSRSNPAALSLETVRARTTIGRCKLTMQGASNHVLKRRIASACVLAISTFSTLFPLCDPRAAEPWSLDENFVGIAIADVAWAVNPSFPGTKFILDGRYSFRRIETEAQSRDCACDQDEPRQRMIGTVSGHLRRGGGDTDTEYLRLGVTALSYQEGHLISTGQFQPIRDTIEWGAVSRAYDYSLDVESYEKVDVTRLERTWGFQRDADSPWLYSMGISVSAGYAWANAIERNYRDISNTIIGSRVRLTAMHRTSGEFFFERSVDKGILVERYTREATVRAGYMRRMSNCLILDFFAEKRSFKFNDPDRYDLYNRTRSLGIGIGCAF